MRRWWTSGNERPQVPAQARNMSPIVPRASISGRALVAVVAIMTFLASITTGAVLLVSASAAEWQSEVASEITIQVRPIAGRDLDRDAAAAAEAMRTQPGIVQVRPFSKDEFGQIAGAVARHRAVDRATAGAARHRRAGPARHHARPCGVARPDDAGGAVGQRRRSSRLDRAHALDDRRDRVCRHRHPRAGDRGDDHFGFVCDPRRDGGEPPDRRGAAFRRRRRQLHRQPLPAAFPQAGPRRRADRRRRRDAGVSASPNRSPAGSRAPRSATSSRRCWGRSRCARRAIWRWRCRRC